MNLSRFETGRNRNRSGPVWPVTAVSGPALIDQATKRVADARYRRTQLGVIIANHVIYGRLADRFFLGFKICTHAWEVSAFEYIRTLMTDAWRMCAYMYTRSMSLYTWISVIIKLIDVYIRVLRTQRTGKRMKDVYVYIYTFQTVVKTLPMDRLISSWTKYILQRKCHTTSFLKMLKNMLVYWLKEKNLQSKIRSYIVPDQIHYKWAVLPISVQ